MQIRSVWQTYSYLCEEEGDGSKREGPAILIAEICFITLGPVQHLIINAGDVENQTHHQRQTCVTETHQFEPAWHHASQWMNHSHKYLTGWRRFQRRRPVWCGGAGCVRCYSAQSRWTWRTNWPVGMASPSESSLHRNQKHLWTLYNLTNLKLVCFLLRNKLYRSWVSGNTHAD